MMKLERIEGEIARTKEAILKQQTHLKELEAQKTEVENLQIVQMVRAIKMTPTELSAFLESKRRAQETAQRKLMQAANRQEDKTNEE